MARQEIHSKNDPGGDYNFRWKDELAELESVKSKDMWNPENILEIRSRLVEDFGVEEYRPTSK